MKKIGLLFLAIVMVLGVAGCHKKDADPVGTWVMTFNWVNDGSGSVVWHIYTGGRFNDSQGNSGTWATDRDDVTMAYSNGTNYGGTVDGDRMSGTMTSVGTGGQGNWAAQRTSSAP